MHNVRHQVCIDKGTHRAKMSGIVVHLLDAKVTY